MDQSAEGQLRVIRKVIAVTQSDRIPVWLFGGWGLDARIGRITPVPRSPPVEECEEARSA